MASASSSKTLPKWNLTDLYESSDSEKLQEDIADVSDRAKRFQKIFQNSLHNIDASILASAIKEYEDIEEVLGKLSSYAYLLYVQDMSDDKIAAFYQNISEKINVISTSLLFFELEINKLSDQEIHNKINTSEELSHYSSWIRDIRAMQPYQLSDEVEKILHEKNITSCQSWHRLFDETLASLTFEFDKETLTFTQIANYLSSNNEISRKKAAKSIGKTLGDNIRIFTFITNTLAKDKEISDKWRNFPKAISSRNISNLIEDEVADSLINSVKYNYAKLSHRYYKIKANLFNKEQLNYWDRNAPIPGANNKKISWNEAADIVLTAYHEFSPDMAVIGKRFFTENWIDAQVRKGKDSGAFSHPTVPSAHPYILMNFQGKIKDVMTLAHELGHGIHQVLSAKQGVLMADTPLTLAETASVFGEQLTFQSLLKRENDTQQRLIMTANKVEDMLNTVVRQIAFCEFEKEVHDKRRKGELSKDEICNIWLKVQQDSLGPAIKFEDEYKFYWSYIPHFIHTPFYVYAYAFGECLVNSLYKIYQDHPEGFVDKYIKMLEAGGRFRHKELLQPFGLNATDPNFWQGGLDIISDFIDRIDKH